MTNRSIPFSFALKTVHLEKVDAWPKRQRSAIIRRLIDAACPVCGSPTHPDKNRPDCLFCPACDEPVIFQGGNG